jgi:hypothetical protein
MRSFSAERRKTDGAIRDCTSNTSSESSKQNQVESYSDIRFHSSCTSRCSTQTDSSILTPSHRTSQIQKDRSFLSAKTGSIVADGVRIVRSISLSATRLMTGE